MKKILIPVLFVLMLMLSCVINIRDVSEFEKPDSADSGNTADTGNTGDTDGTGNTTDDSTSDPDIIADDSDDDIGDTINDFDTGDTGNTGNSGATCTGSDKFCHSHDGLNWSDASSDEMDWDEAITYCENLGGRLPAISELRTLIQNCPETETGGECSVTNSCLSDDCWNVACRGCRYGEPGKYSVFGDIVWLWSSSVRSDDAVLVWLVGFDYVHVGDWYKDHYGYVRCVKLKIPAVRALPYRLH
ncbi:MAG TPA: DUF1566 domain-containing protein [bacterium]|nr:DUF1566 domain-containing protein [bacterium]